MVQDHDANIPSSDLFSAYFSLVCLAYLKQVVAHVKQSQFKVKVRWKWSNKQTNKTSSKTETHKGDGLMKVEGRKRSVIIVHQSSIHDLFLSAASASTFRFPPYRGHICLVLIKT